MAKKIVTLALLAVLLMTCGCAHYMYPRQPAPLPDVAKPNPAAAPVDLRVSSSDAPTIGVTFTCCLKDAKVWLIPENPHSLRDPRLVMEGNGDEFQLWLTEEHEYTIIVKVYDQARYQYLLGYIRYQASPLKVREPIDQAFLGRMQGRQSFREDPSLLDYKVRHKL